MASRALVRAVLTLNTAEYMRLNRAMAGTWIARWLDRLVRFAFVSETSPFPLPWTVAGAPPALNTLRRRSLRTRRQEIGLGAALLRLAVWPAAVLVIGLGLTLRNGAAVRRLVGTSAPVLAAKVIWASLRHNVAPTDMFLLRLFQPERRAGLSCHVAPRDNYPFHAILQPRHPDIDLVDDKVAFHDHCRANGLPTPDVVVAFGYKDQAVRWIDGDRLPAGDLFSKPIDRFRGIGARLWIHDPTTRTWSGDMGPLDAEALIRELGRESCLVQPRLRPHPVMAGFSPLGFATIRVITLRFPSGTIETLCAMLKFAAPGEIVDKISTGGMIAPIELETGRLGAAFMRDFSRGVFDHHAETGARIEGTHVPCWTEIIEIASRGHATLPGLTSIGWDFAATDSGVSIVEANVGWGFETVQLAMHRGLGETRFVAWADAVLAAQGPG